MEILLGVLASFLSGLIFSPYFRDLFLQVRRRISWNKFIKSLTDARVLRDLGHAAPNLIIGLNDGIVPGAILARNLQINDLVYCRVENPDNANQYIHGLEGINIANSRVLIIDDQILSGRNMAVAYHAIQRLHGAESASLFRMAVFEYDVPAICHTLEIRPIARTKGQIKLEPWSFSDYHKSRALPRKSLNK